MDKLYDASGAARVLKLRHATVSKHIKEGNINTVFVKHLGSNGKVMITSGELYQFIHNHYRGDRANALGRLKEEVE